MLDQLQGTLAKSQVFHGNLGRQIKVFPDNVQQQFLSSTRFQFFGGELTNGNGVFLQVEDFDS